ncbi:hypothetical protein LBMAG52_35520 [Planctomycetia bacterium]|nr:hypothetical protein LBMAG52_35520 [Planctomycetia bacterium]
MHSARRFDRDEVTGGEKLFAQRNGIGLQQWFASGQHNVLDGKLLNLPHQVGDLDMFPFGAP